MSVNQNIKINPRAALSVDFNEFRDGNLIRALVDDAVPDADALEPNDLVMLNDGEGNVAFGSIESRRERLLFVRVNWETFKNSYDESLDFNLVAKSNVLLLTTTSNGQACAQLSETWQLSDQWGHGCALRQFDLTASTAGQR